MFENDTPSKTQEDDAAAAADAAENAQGRKDDGTKMKKKLSCPTCSKSFNSVSHVLQHLAKRHLRRPLKTHVINGGRTCKFCRKEFKKRNDATTHVGLVHRSLEIFADQDQLEWMEKFWTKKKKDREIKVIPTKFCKKKKDENRESKVRDARLSCPTKFLKKEEKESRVSRLSCPTCRRSFSRSRDVFEHLATDHFGDRLREEMVSGESCNICGLWSFGTLAAVRHVAFSHGPRIYKFADPEQLDWIEKFGGVATLFSQR